MLISCGSFVFFCAVSVGIVDFLLGDRSAFSLHCELVHSRRFGCVVIFVWFVGFWICMLQIQVVLSYWRQLAGTLAKFSPSG